LRESDQLVEGRESFRLSLSAPGVTPLRETIEIAEDGTARLSVRAPQTASGEPVIFRGVLALQRSGDRAIAIGAGGSLTYANDNTPPQTLIFADADRDGLLAGDELSAASAPWAVLPDRRARTFTLQNAGALPAGLQSAQFLPAGGAPAHVPAPPLVALNRDVIVLAEGADFAAATLSVNIRPALAARGELLLSYTAGSADAGDYISTSARLTLPAGVTEVAVPGGIRDDLISESQEQYTVTITAPPGANYAIDPTGGSVTVRIDDNDIAGVIFPPPPPADAGAEIALSARLSGVVQVGASAVLRIADAANNVAARFIDENGDGLLSGEEESKAAFTWLSPLGDFGATTFRFAVPQDAPRGLAAANFDIGARARLGRKTQAAHMRCRWHSAAMSRMHSAWRSPRLLMRTGHSARPRPKRA